MRTSTLKKMQHFVGRVCSIVTTSMNRAFDEKISREHFVIRVMEIGEDGIWGSHPYNDEMISFFTLRHIISIHEEIELDPSNPEHAEMIRDYEKKTGSKVQPDIKRVTPKPAEQSKTELLPVIEPSPAFEVEADPNTGDVTFVDIVSLERLAETTKRTFDAYDLLSQKKI